MIVWTLAVLAVIVAGWRLAPDFGWPFRISAAFVIGATWLTTVMFAAAVTGLRWHVAWLVVALALPILFTRGRADASSAHGAEAPKSRADRAAFAAQGGRGVRPSSGVIAAFAALTAYGVLTARETCADLLYFWGTKAARFAAAKTIDLAFLADPAHHVMHPDYPPLVPLLYAWGAMFTWSYWGPLLLSAIVVALAAFLVQPFSNAGAVLMAALLAFTCAQGLAAGAADPLLLLFEVAALVALTFADHAVLASIALAAAAMTKVEGAAFVAVVVVAYAIVSRKPLRAIAIALPAAVLLGGWLGWAPSLASYGRGAFQFSTANLIEVAKTASYNAYYLPWLALLVPLAMSRWRKAALPILVAAGSLASLLFFYMHADPNPHLWIAVSAERVLITPLAALAVAVARASE